MFSTAIVAGVMAVKKTSELIPFCHPLPIEKCDIQVRTELIPCSGNRCVVQTRAVECRRG